MSEHGVYAIETPENGECLEIWCPEQDEEKLIVWPEYVTHCPMCGTNVENPKA